MLTTPIIRCLKKQLDGASVHLLTKSNMKSVLEPNPYLDKIITIDDDFDSILKSLKEEHYDYIVDLHNNLRSRRFRHALGVQGAAFPKLNIEKWLLVNFKINRLPKKHIVERYFEAVKILNIHNDEHGLDFFVPTTLKSPAAKLPLFFQEGYIGLVVGGQHATKKLPVDRLRKLCEKMKHPIVLLGGPEDRYNAAKISEGLGSRVLNACGSYSLQESALLVRDARLIITHDTGLMHIAAAYQKPIITLWGNTVSDFGMSPYLLKDGFYTGFEQKLDCRPCSKIGFDACPKGHFKCMKNQPLDEIAEKVEEYWINAPKK